MNILRHPVREWARLSAEKDVKPKNIEDTAVA
jgi:hypothetical protein